MDPLLPDLPEIWTPPSDLEAWTESQKEYLERKKKQYKSWREYFERLEKEYESFKDVLKLKNKVDSLQTEFYKIASTPSSPEEVVPFIAQLDSLLGKVQSAEKAIIRGEEQIKRRLPDFEKTTVVDSGEFATSISDLEDILAVLSSGIGSLKEKLSTLPKIQRIMLMLKAIVKSLESKYRETNDAFSGKGNIQSPEQVAEFIMRLDSFIDDAKSAKKAVEQGYAKIKAMVPDFGKGTIVTLGEDKTTIRLLETTVGVLSDGMVFNRKNFLESPKFAAAYNDLRKRKGAAAGSKTAFQDLC